MDMSPKHPTIPEHARWNDGCRPTRDRLTPLISEHEARLRRLVASNGPLGRENETIVDTDRLSSKTQPDRQGGDLDAADRALAASNGMSEREDDILCLLARGVTMNNVSRLLDISVRSVAYHKYSFMDRHDLRTTAQLAAFVKSAGIGRR